MAAYTHFYTNQCTNDRYPYKHHEGKYGQAFQLIFLF